MSMPTNATGLSLRGTVVGLRARHEDDVPLLHAGLHDDVETRVRADTRSWRPIPTSADLSPYRPAAPTPDAAVFSVVRLGDGTLAGEAMLWRIDAHNRSAHLGISLLPAARGQGFGADTVELLCRYGFSILGLHRLQLETLGDNAAMQRAAARVGFVQEGLLREVAWVNGGFGDEVVMGLLARDWRAAPGRIA